MYLYWRYTVPAPSPVVTSSTWCACHTTTHGGIYTPGMSTCKISQAVGKLYDMIRRIPYDMCAFYERHVKCQMMPDHVLKTFQLQEKDETQAFAAGVQTVTAGRDRTARAVVTKGTTERYARKPIGLRICSSSIDTTSAKIRGSAVSSSFIIPHRPQDTKRQKKYQQQQEQQ